MRVIDEHKVNPGNDVINITVMDEPGQGGANHAYLVQGINAYKNPAVQNLKGWQDDRELMVLFQDGPISENGNGVNGITHEVLLAIVADRLRGFQSGPYACKANACALTHVEEAMHWLQQRTLERMRRGVEGTHIV